MNRCFNCGRSKSPRHYLCPPCWYGLSHAARIALWRHDAKASERLRELYGQIEEKVPLSEIAITP